MTRPRKPTATLGHIVFGRGKPHAQLERLPDTKDELELAVVRKFAGALAEMEQRHLTNLRRVDAWPDFAAEEAGRPVGIELVEVVNGKHAVKRARQLEYLARLEQLLADVLPLLSGLSITFDDRDQNPPYPPLCTKQGIALAQSIADHLRSTVPLLEQTALGQLFQHRWQSGSYAPVTGIYGRRFAPMKSSAPLRLLFAGTFSEYVRVSESLLAATVFRKVKRSYQKYADGSLWLLAYEVGTMSVGAPPSRAAHLAQIVLSRRKHPFDEVWYLYPYARPLELGSMERVWPAP